MRDWSERSGIQSGFPWDDKKIISRFLNEIRISQACQQLLETDATVTGIAHACGFGTLSNFNRRFLVLRGETPMGFHKRRQQPANANGMGSNRVQE
jgi:AraC-like DNA-binding protein